MDLNLGNVLTTSPYKQYSWPLSSISICNSSSDTRSWWNHKTTSILSNLFSKNDYTVSALVIWTYKVTNFLYPDDNRKTSRGQDSDMYIQIHMHITLLNYTCMLQDIATCIQVANSANVIRSFVPACEPVRMVTSHNRYYLQTRQILQ